MKDDFQTGLDGLKTTGQQRPRPDCPAEVVWPQLAAGLLPEAQAAELLDHSSGCDACALLLRQATEDFAEEVQPQEDEQIRGLASARPDRQRALAEKLAAQQVPARKITPFPAPRPRPAFRWAWAYAAAAVVLLTVFGALTLKLGQPSPDQLLASAYTQQRPFEMRIAGAAHGLVRQQRNGQSGMSTLSTFHSAQVMIIEGLQKRPDDAALLAAQGKTKLLNGEYEDAIRTFGRLLGAQPDSPALLIDLATAHYQRGLAADRTQDFGQAVDLLGRALAKSPDDPVALFNSALALEKMFMYGEAVRAWEHYLRVDANGAWADEARQRLSDLRQLMKEREKPTSLLHADPLKAAPLLRARAAGAPMPDGTPWAPALDEEYQDIAVREWLPSLYLAADSETVRGPVGRGAATGDAPAKAGAAQRWRRDPGAWEALQATAVVLRTHHQDAWLTDLLWDLPADSAPPPVIAQFAAALDALARASKANAAGDPDTARPLAESAARAFRAARSTPGLLRAREEVINSLVRAARTQDCIHATSRQIPARNLESYPWLRGQATLWQATCQNRAANLDLAQRLSEQALELTKNSRFAGQNLRSVLFASGFLRSTERNWQHTRAGLSKFWADWHNALHAYESYVELAIYAEDSERWQLARLLRREALSMVKRTPDRPYQAVAHFRLAGASIEVRDLPEAEEELRIASQQFVALSSSPTARFFRAGSEIHLAAIELQQNRLDSAEARLEQAKPNLAGISTTWTAFNYHQTLGQLRFRRGDLLEAEKALWNAVEVSEPRLGSLETDADRLGWERDAGRAYRSLVDLLAQKKETVVRALEVWEWYRASAVRGPAGADARASPALMQVAETLPVLKTETILSFAVLPSRIAAWSFDDRGVHFERLTVSEQELTGRVKYFAFLCADPGSDLTRLREEGRNLYDALLGPLEKHLDHGRVLIIEPDSFLSEVPWPALVDPRGEYLGARFAIVISPGLGYWRNLRPAAIISRGQKALVVGMPALASSVAARFVPLPDADREARGIAARFRNPRLLSGSEVAASEIRRELAQAAVFHFAGHAVSGVTQSGLVLASASVDSITDEPTILSADDLVGSRLQRLQLVVLSACATGETEKGFAEPDTLVRGFLRAGVPHVVASRWPVDSRSAEQTMAGFYGNLMQSQPVANALQQALYQLRREPSTAHPYHWAAFAAYGR